MQQGGSAWSAIGGLVLIAAAAWFFFGGGLEQQTQREMSSLHSQVANDAVAQYEITDRNGTPVDKCVAAGMVVAAYLQAQDEPNYAKWKSVQTAQCKAAGVPM